jgi:hypothetical protein
MSEVNQTWVLTKARKDIVKPQIQLVFRIFDGSDAVEIVQTVAPGDNEELGLQLGRRDKVSGVNVYEATTWQADTNGMQLVSRANDPHRPIGGNTYPVCRIALTTLPNSSNANALLFSHVHGVSSPSTGTLQMMVHRRGTGGEFPPLGMSIPLNDTIPVVDRSWWLMNSSSGPAGGAIVDQALAMQSRLEHPAIVSFSDHGTLLSAPQRHWQGMKANLPSFVTLEYLGAIEPSTQVRVLRLLYLPPLDTSNEPVTVNLNDTFDFDKLNLKADSAQEVMLSTMMTVEQANRTRWPAWIKQPCTLSSVGRQGSPCGAFDKGSTSICLAPGQTRTLAFDV